MSLPATIKQPEKRIGRPKGAKNKRTLWLEQEAQKHAGDALKALVSIAKNKEASDAARVAAANSLLDRAYGRARQSVEHTGEGGGPVEVAVTHRVVDAD